MKRIYGIAHMKWVVPADQHEPWHEVHGRLGSPVRFHNSDEELHEMFFALAEANHTYDSFIVPIHPLFEETLELLKEGAVFDVLRDGHTVVAVGRVLSLQSADEADFQHIFHPFSGNGE